MKIALLLILLFPLIATASDDCEGPEGSSYWEGCMTNKEIDDMNKKLDAEYQIILKKYQEANRRTELQNFIVEQRKWKDGLFERCEQEDGVNSIEIIRCRYSETESRLNELLKLDEELH